MTVKDTNQILPGNTYGKLTVVSFSHVDKRNRKHFHTVCECGNSKVIHGASLKSGNTRSCGCLCREVQSLRKLPDNQGAFNAVFFQARVGAKKRNIPFELSISLVTSIAKQPCHYCGVVGGNFKTTKNCKEGIRYNGMDRLNSQLGYTPENVVPCCRDCNFMKGTKTREEFLEHLKKVYSHLNL